LSSHRPLRASRDGCHVIIVVVITSRVARQTSNIEIRVKKKKKEREMRDEEEESCCVWFDINHATRMTSVFRVVLTLFVFSQKKDIVVVVYTAAI